MEKNTVLEKNPLWRAEKTLKGLKSLGEKLQESHNTKTCKKKGGSGIF